jgi:restriction system protein
LSPRPENLVLVHPLQLAAAAVSEPADDAPMGLSDLLALDPIDFEDLVAVLFKAMGMEVMTTERSGDGGVDVRAMDPDPIRGGKLVIQVKRYRNTIPPGTRPLRHNAARRCYQGNPRHHG